MGWFFDEHPGHEGHVVGLVRREGCDGDIFRELSYPDDVARADVVRIQAACECGWRSPYRVPARGIECAPRPDGSVIEFRLPRYSPHSVEVTEGDEAHCRRLWHQHIGVA